jgi:PST family polysaccharide transporter
MLVIRLDGLEAAGLFHAAWTIAGLYMGLVLQALGTDFFPLLSARIKDPPAARAALDSALRMALAVTLPLALGVAGGAPVVLALFFSADFMPGAGLLALLAVASLLKVLSITLGYVILAEGRSWLYFTAELVQAAVFLGLTAALHPAAGLAAVGYAQAAGFLCQMLVAWAAARQGIGWRASGAVAREMGVAALLGLGTLAASRAGLWAGLAAGAAFGLLAGLRGLGYLAGLAPDGPGARFGRLGARLTAWLPWGKGRRE